MRVLIIAGGTGGHIYPGIAIAQRLKKDKVEILFVGRSKGMEADIIAKYKFPYRGIAGGALPRKLSLVLIKNFFKWIIGFVQSIKILGNFKPQVIFSTGGYVSFPLVLGAWLLRIPVVIHEQNTISGLSNRLAGKLADKITVTFPESKKYFATGKVYLTGNPIREEILCLDRAVAIKNLELKKDRLNILLLGGSAGAHSLNVAMKEALDFLAEFKYKLQFIHLSGVADYELVRSAYFRQGYEAKIFPFMYDIENAYRAADLVICRAGATTLAEITALGLAAILIPYPFATADHQRKNAEVLAQTGAGVMILNEDLTGTRLAEEIINLVKDQNKLSLMSANSAKLGRPRAVDEIAGIVFGLGAKEKNKC
jgi:UDP-N-acetylglucosamine--N-acetylmuramyl-(pentapeptide) pyrophosphoryl-undecaprenol N-acetylglucosamine transferase